MEIENRIAVITGGASGIGAALAKRFSREGAAGIAIADTNAVGLAEIATMTGALPVECDVTSEADIQALISKTETELGPVDIFISNAGVARLGDEDAPDAEWQLNWDVHVMAHVYAVRAIAPKMVKRGGGYLVHTASAAGLLSHIQSATYSVSKHATVAFAEWVQIKYRHQGIRVSVLAPQAVRTPMIERPDGAEVASVDGLIEPEELAECVVKSMAEEQFLILPHPVVGDYLSRKYDDIDRWLAGMNRWRQDQGPA